jgi:hypothetical protein
MTAIIGFINGQSAVLCADSLEVKGEYSKSSVQKIHTVTYFNNYRIGIGGAALDGVYLEVFERRLSALLADVREFDYSKITAAIEKSLTEVHKKHIWPKQLPESQFQALIVIQGIKPTPSRSLLMTHDNTLLPVQEYRTVGIGADLADYLRKLLFPTEGSIYNAPTEILVNAGIYMIAEIKKHVPFVDGPTSITVFDGITGEIDWKSTATLALSEMWAKETQDAELGLHHMLMWPSMSQADWEKAWNYFKFKIEAIRGSQRNFLAGHPVLCPGHGVIRQVTPVPPPPETQPEEKTKQSASRKSKGRR